MRLDKKLKSPGLSGHWLTTDVFIDSRPSQSHTPEMRFLSPLVSTSLRNSSCISIDPVGLPVIEQSWEPDMWLCAVDRGSLC